MNLDKLDRREQEPVGNIEYDLKHKIAQLVYGKESIAKALELKTESITGETLKKQILIDNMRKIEERGHYQLDCSMETLAAEIATDYIEKYFEEEFSEYETGRKNEIKQREEHKKDTVEEILSKDTRAYINAAKIAQLIKRPQYLEKAENITELKMCIGVDILYSIMKEKDIKRRVDSIANKNYPPEEKFKIALRALVADISMYGVPYYPQLTEKVSGTDRFIIERGQKIRSVYELAETIETMPEEIWNHHTRHRNNDFANWIEHVYGNKTLAEKVRKTREKTRLKELLQKSLLEERGETA